MSEYVTLRQRTQFFARLDLCIDDESGFTVDIHRQHRTVMITDFGQHERFTKPWRREEIVRQNGPQSGGTHLANDNLFFTFILIDPNEFPEGMSGIFKGNE